MTLVSLLALAGSGASALEGENPDEAFTAFSLKGSNGYSMFVFALRGENDGKLESSALVFVLRRHRHVVVSAPAKVTTALVEGVPAVTSVDLRLGRLGRISVQFVAAGRQRVTHSSCGSGLPISAGTFEGTIEFHGEEDFTDFSATSVAARPEVFFNLVCSSVSHGEEIGGRLPGARLRVDTDRGALRERINPGAREVSLQVNENRPGGPVWVETSIEERRGPVAIQRSLAQRTARDAFAFTDDVSRARFSPAGPFDGRGIFQRAAKPRNRWRGNLTVDFPGRSNVRLAGPGLHATLVHARLIGGIEIADERFTRVLRAIVR